MKKIGFIGLGNMGMGMAKNLLNKGFTVKGFDIRREVRNGIKQFGGIPVNSTAETAVDSDVVFIMVVNGQQVISVIEGGLKEKLAKGTTVILCPTIGRNYVKQAEALLVPLGVNEPGTGEINFDKIKKVLKELKYDGFFGFELTPLESSEKCAKILKDF